MKTFKLNTAISIICFYSNLKRQNISFEKTVWILQKQPNSEIELNQKILNKKQIWWA